MNLFQVAIQEAIIFAFSQMYYLFLPTPLQPHLHTGCLLLCRHVVQHCPSNGTFRKVFGKWSTSIQREHVQYTQINYVQAKSLFVNVGCLYRAVTNPRAYYKPEAHFTPIDKISLWHVFHSKATQTRQVLSNTLAPKSITESLLIIILFLNISDIFIGFFFFI